MTIFTSRSVPTFYGARRALALVEGQGRFRTIKKALNQTGTEILASLNGYLATAKSTSHLGIFTADPALLHSVINSIGDLIFVLDKTGCFVSFYQPHKEEEYSIPPEIFFGQHFSRIGLPPELIAKTTTAFAAISAGSISATTFDYQIEVGSNLRWYHINMTKRVDQNGNFAGTTCVSRDITELKTAELALRRSEEKYRQLADYVFDMECQLNPQGDFVYVSPASLELTGYPASDFLERRITFRQLVHPEDQAIYDKHFATAMDKQNQESCRLQVRLNHKDGSIRSILHRCKNIYDQAGNWLGRRVNNQDITHQEYLEKALHSTLDLLNAQFLNSPDIILILDRQLKFLAINQIVVGPNSREELVGMDAVTVLPPAIQEIIRTALNQCLATQKPQEIEHEIGEGKLVRARMIPLGSDRLLVISTDITEQKRLENQAERTSKIEVAAQIAGMIAHDLNNHLGVVTGNAEIALDEAGLSADIRNYFEEILKAGYAIKELTTQLMTIATKKDPFAAGKVEFQNVSKLLEESRPFTALLFAKKHNYYFAMELNAQGKIKGDRDELIRVIQNLLINAQHAMPKGGKLSITTQDVTIPEPLLKDYITIPTGHYVLISISDNGTGIKSEDLPNIFIAGFTTKGEKGTGLGLASVYRIVKNHGGFINVDSTVRQGTTFHLYFPAVTT